ncbi:MAG: DUF6364 family protein [Spirochaetota bacterium]
MDSKLTLKLDKTIIEKAKTYAMINNTSLSQMVEKYFIAILTETNYDNYKLSPIVKELSGVIKPFPSDDLKNDYTEYLIKKYK